MKPGNQRFFPQYLRMVIEDEALMEQIYGHGKFWTEQSGTKQTDQNEPDRTDA